MEDNFKQLFTNSSFSISHLGLSTIINKNISNRPPRRQARNQRDMENQDHVQIHLPPPPTKLTFFDGNFINTVHNTRPDFTSLCSFTASYRSRNLFSIRVRLFRPAPPLILKIKTFRNNY